MTVNHWIEIFYCLQQCLKTVLVIIFLRAFYDVKFQWNRKKAIIFLFLAITNLLARIIFVTYPFWPLALFMTFIDLLYIIIAIYDYDGKRLKGCFRFLCVSVLFDLCAAQICLVASFYILPNFSAELMVISENEELFRNVFYVLCFGIILVPLYLCVHKRSVVVKCGNRERIFMIVYILLIWISYFALMSAEKGSQTATVILSIFYVIAYILFPFFVYSLSISEYYQQRTKLQEVYLQAEVEHFRQYMHAQEETRRFRHDIRNNLLCMNDMVSSGNNEKLEQYLKELLEITDSLSFKYVSGDDLLDSILNSKAPYMEQQGILFELDGVLAGGLPWKPMDICAVFANAVDNAIEACQKVPPKERHISMSIKSTPQFWLISIENSVAEAVDTKKLFQKNAGYTSKSDSSRHGIGTYSMKRTVESYGAIMEAKCTEQVFTLEIMIDKTKTTK